MDQWFFKFGIIVFAVWLAQALCSEFVVNQPARKFIVIVVFVLATLFVLSGGPVIQLR